MSKTAKTVIGIIVVLIVIWGARMLLRSNTQRSQTSPFPDKTAGVPVKIGFIGALTGDAASYGEPARDAVAIAVDEINKNGGMNGRPVEVVYEDGKCNGRDAASAAQKLVNIDKVKMVIGGSCSGEVLAMAPITEPAKVLVLTPSASNPKISEIGDYVFRNLPSDAETGKQLAEVVVKTHKKVAVISENTEYAQGLRQVFNANLAKLGGQLSYDESFAPKTEDFRSLISKAKATGPQAIFINTQAGGAAARIAKQARELGLRQQFYVAYWSGPDYVGSGPAVEGTIIVDVPGLNEENPRAAKLLTAYKQRYGKNPTYPYYTGTAYDAVYLFTNAMKSVGEDTAKMRDYLYNLSNFEGAIGNYRFDRNGDVVGIRLTVLKIEKGKVVKMK